MPLPLVFTRTMAVAAGWRPADVDKELRAGRWTALRRSVYARTADVPDDACRRAPLDVLAAQLASGHELVGSHETAAQVHGLPLSRDYDGPVVLTDAGSLSRNGRARASRHAWCRSCRHTT